MYRCSFALFACACSVSSAGSVVIAAHVAPAVVSGPVDSDGDGLSDPDEAAAGADPSLADSDRDGLDDGVEAALSTDPTAMDTDGDGFLDADEVREYRDPLDATSVLYEGGWPYTADRPSYTQKADGC